MVTVACGLSAFFLIAQSPDNTRFLSAKERAYAAARLRHDNMHGNDVVINGETHHLKVDDGFAFKTVLSVFQDPQMWILALIAFTSGTLVFSQA